MALIDTAYDKDPKVRENISASLLELGKKQPELLLTSCLVYLHKHAKVHVRYKLFHPPISNSCIYTQWNRIKGPLRPLTEGYIYD